MPFPAKITEEVIEYAIQLIQRGYPKGERKRRIAEKFGFDNAKSMEKVFRLANAELRKLQGTDLAGEIGASIGFYRELLHDDAAPYSAKLAARERIDKLMGLERLPPVIGNGQIRIRAIQRDQPLPPVTPPESTDGTG